MRTIKWHNEALFINRYAVCTSGRILFYAEFIVLFGPAVLPEISSVLWKLKINKIKKDKERVNRK